MHGPDGKNFNNESRFVEIVVPERISLDHISAPRFRLTVLFEELGDRTKLTFRQLFETSSVYDRMKKLAVPANEENLDRLADLVAGKSVESRT
jgi:Activator of Hsp90 ATPase homolog 1-like protein